MSMIPEVKCRRCGEIYSSMRSRCPNCGTRRVAQSGRTPATTASTVKGTASYERAETNTKWQMIFGLILVVAVILAVIVMVSTSLNNADGPTNHGKVTPPLPTASDAMPSIDVAPTPTPTATPSIERVDIYNFTVKLGDENKKTGYSPTLNLANPDGLSMSVTAATYPVGLAMPEDIHWSCSDDSVLKLTPQDDGSCLVEILAAKGGGVRLYCEIFGVSTECLVYCVDVKS